MSNKNTIFYHNNKTISVDFIAEEISSDGSLVLLEKLEREHGLTRIILGYSISKPNYLL